MQFSKLKSALKDHGINILIFLAWTVTSFLCHHFAKTFLRLCHSSIESVLTVTTCQLVLCYSILQDKYESGKNSSPVRLAARAGHVIGTLATNYSMSLIHASSTLTIKMMEPITSAFVQRLVIKTPIPTATLFSLPIIVIGAIMFTGNPFIDPVMTKGLLLALVSNIALAVRNVAMKFRFEDHQQLIIWSPAAVFTVPVLAMMPAVVMYSFGYTNILPQAGALVISALAHVLYSYLSVALVLKSVSVVTHAVLNIFKRVFVVLLLCAVGTRVVGLQNLLGLLVAVIGLAVYVRGKAKKTVDNSKPDVSETPAGRQINMRLALFLVASICCITISDFRISPPAQRELKRSTSFTIADQLRSWLASPLEGTGTVFNPESGPVPGLPFDGNKNMLTLQTMEDVIAESQNYNIRLFQDLIGQYPYIVHVDIAAHENKGDAAISLGEIVFLRQLKKKLLFYCRSINCSSSHLWEAHTQAQKIGKDKVAVVSHGGGNIVGYPRFDLLRETVFKIFNGYKTLVFPQSIWLTKNESHFKYCKEMYARYPNVTFLIRDFQSLERARTVLSRNNLVLAPDIAFQIGYVPRSFRPHYDIIWIQREDVEKSDYNTSQLDSHGLSMLVSDWTGYQPTRRVPNTMERVNVIAENGFVFLQRGKVLITDRLHGHIMSTLLHMPHVLLDTPDMKLAAYHNTWTKGLEGRSVFTAKGPQDAIDKAAILIERYGDQLPKIESFMYLENAIPLVGNEDVINEKSQNE